MSHRLGRVRALGDEAIPRADSPEPEQQQQHSERLSGLTDPPEPSDAAPEAPKPLVRQREPPEQVRSKQPQVQKRQRLAGCDRIAGTMIAKAARLRADCLIRSLLATYGRCIRR